MQNHEEEAREDPGDFTIKLTEKLFEERFECEEEQLDTDFFFLLTHAEAAYRTVRLQEDRTICEEWLKRIIGRSAETVSEKRSRNKYLAQLIVRMGAGYLGAPFHRLPPPANQQLQPIAKVFAATSVGREMLADVIKKIYPARNILDKYLTIFLRNL